MSSGKNRHFLSFEILDGGNSETLIFLDTSSYYKNPETPILESTPPGYDNPFFTNIVFGKINVLNSSTIGIDDILETDCLSNLPDGVWKFKFKVCPYDQVFTVQYHLRTTILDRTLDSIFESLDFSDCDLREDEKLKKDIVDIILSIQAGKADARLGEIKKAGDLYQIASDLAKRTLDRVNQKCRCA